VDINLRPLHGFSPMFTLKRAWDVGMEHAVHASAHR